MHPARTKLPAYRKHKPSGQAVVTLSGRDIYLGPHGARLSRDNYDRVVAEWLAAGRSLPHRDAAGGGLEVVQLLNAFRKSGEIPASQAHAYAVVIKLLNRLYGRTAAADFGPLSLRAVREQMIASGWKRHTINQRIHNLRRIFRWGVSREMVPAAVLQALESVEGLRKGKSRAPESKAIAPVSIDHVEACLPLLTPTLQAMVRLQMLTGMRAAELCQLRTGDVDTSGKVWVYRPGSHKTEHHGKTRDVAIGPKAIEVLRPWLQTDLQAYVFSPARSEAERLAARHAARKTSIRQGNRPGSNRSAKPQRPPGERYDTAGYRRAIYYACDRAFPPPAPLARAKGETAAAWRERLGPAKVRELKKWRAAHRWHPHQLRHTFADQVRRQFGLDHAQKALGHAHANVTERYAQVALEKAVEVAAAIG